MRPILAVFALALAVSASAAIPSSERDALVALYQSTNGSSWTNHANWLGAAGTECTWFGVHCDSTNAHVVGLELYQNNLAGPLPADLRKLTALRDLHMWGNAITGSLPSVWSELADIETIIIETNHLTGTVPPSWGAMKKLVRLDLHSNELTGPLSAALGSMTALQSLSLGYNQIVRTIPKELGNLRELEDLSLGTNKLEGPIPKELGSLPKLQILNLSDNDLSGSIPPELGNLSSLVFLELSFNDLTGGVPSALGNLDTVEEIDVANNPLGGTIPKELGGLATIKRLYLNDAQLTGTIPEELWNIRTLEELSVATNQLVGSISSSVEKLANLQVLWLYDNDLEGTIPLAITNMITLRSLGLARNRLTGPIPPELSRLTNLIALDLAENSFHGNIPPQLGSFSKLEVLNVAGNQLEGTIPRELGQLLTLTQLDVSTNRLTGAIPDELRNLKELRQFAAGTNQLTGSIPVWIGDWSHLTDLFLGRNRLSGTVPAGLATLVNLTFLDLSENDLRGAFPDLSRMSELVYLLLNYNSFSGPLPPALGSLANLATLSIGNNALSGPIPKELGSLERLEYFDLSNNLFEGPIPPELGDLENVYNISLWGNRLTGTIPASLSKLKALRFLDLSFNALRGPIPAELTQLTGLDERYSDFAYNALFTNDERVRAFINSKHYDGDFEQTQTVMPTNVRITQTTDRSATLTWTPIRYDYNAGGYQVLARNELTGQVKVATTSSKGLDTITVRNLLPETPYTYTVSTVTHPHSGVQKNLIVSDPSPRLQAPTGKRVVAPPEAVITEQPTGMVQVDGVEVVFDSFAVTNFGDTGTQLTLERGGDFFTATPESFSLAAGATQVVTLRSLPRPAGSYYGHVSIQGAGAADDLIAYTVLLSTSRPAGTVVAQPLRTSIELAGASGSEGIGVAQFRNAGTARLTGIVLSDQPWIEPSREPITIEPGAVGTVNFRVLRARRPGGQGTLVANLRLVYVNGGAFARGVSLLGTPPPPGVSVSIVSIVDTTRPPVTTGSIPAPGAGEFAFFIPGMRSTSTARSDLSLLNLLGGRSISDLRLYFTQGAQTQIAALQPLEASGALNLANVVGSIYSTEGTGTLQIRTTDSESVSGSAKISLIVPNGTQGGALPIFRGDRSIVTGQSIVLTGIGAPGDLVLQETGGDSASVHIELLNASGGQVGTRDALLGAYELVELADAIPAGAATAVVTSVSGALTAYARLRDASGDVWSVVDWSRYYQYEQTEAVRVPFANGRSGKGKRQAVRHADATRFSTNLALFNPGSEETRARVDVVETSGTTTSREVTLAPRTTLFLNDAGGSAGSATAHVVITPLRGRIVASARSRGSAGGTAVPVLSATAGLRIGQRQAFIALEDSTAMQTSYGFVETSGASATIRARIFIEGASTSLVTAVTERDYELAPSQQVFVAELLRSFAGDARDGLGDQRNLVLEVEVVAGSGSIVPFVLTTDAGSDDTSLTVQ